MHEIIPFAPERFVGFGWVFGWFFLFVCFFVEDSLHKTSGI